MIRVIDIIWVEDAKAYLPSIEDEIIELERDFSVDLTITERNDSTNLPEIAGNIPSSLAFLIDYNLKKADGSGIDGDQVIKNIRAINPNCTIFFYSANLNAQELRELIDSNDAYTICVYRPNLLPKLREMLENREI